jgi:anti-sigma regulatory factor (Ser/Thr protein kinase)
MHQRGGRFASSHEVVDEPVYLVDERHRDLAASLYTLAFELLESSRLQQTVAALSNFLIPAYTNCAWLEVRREDGRQMALPLPQGDDPLPLPRAVDNPLERCESLSIGADEIARLHFVPDRVLDHYERTALRYALEYAGRGLRNVSRFERERTIAVTIAHAAVGLGLPVVPTCRFDASYIAADSNLQVGGDWYDAFALPDGRIVISIGDVMGSGLDAAITMLNVRQAIRGVAQVHAEPALMLESADRTLAMQHPGRYVTAFVGILDLVTERISFANAGHPAPLVRYADASVFPLWQHGLPLGFLFTENYAVHEATLLPGCSLVLYTDGLIENTRDICEGEERLQRLVAASDLARMNKPATYLSNAILHGRSTDDAAVLVVDIVGSASTKRWRFDPMWSDVSTRVRVELMEAMREWGYLVEALPVAELIFSELIANAVRYAPGVVELILERRQDAASLHLLDGGRGFVFIPKLPADLFSESGRGLFLISSLAREFTVERRPGGGSHARVTFEGTLS